MKYFFLTFLVLFVSYNIYSQNFDTWAGNGVDLKLVNNKTNKVKVLKADRAIYFNTKITLKNSDTISSYREVSGELIGITNTTITLQPKSDNYYHYRSTMGSQQIWNSYGFFEQTDPVKLKKNKISEIAYQTRSAATFESIGAAGAVFGLMTSLIVAPLASIQYRKGGFNKDRYFALAGGGLAAATIGFTLVGIFDARRFQINPQFENGKNNWNFAIQ